MTDTPSISVGTKFGHLEVVGIDSNGRHIAVRCICSRVLTLSVDALRDGRDSCGCRPPSRADNKAILEAKREGQRRRIFNWRLENGR